MEPDLKWERFVTAVRLLAERLGVRRTIGLGAIPMAVPHTRPVTMTAHSNNRELIADHHPWVGEVQVPSSVSNLLEFRMAQHGHDAVGFTVHVPHYLAQTDYPAAARALLEQVAESASLQFPLRALTEAAAAVRSKIDEQVEASAEVPRWSRALEQQYDAFVYGAGEPVTAGARRGTAQRRGTGRGVRALPGRARRGFQGRLHRRRRGLTAPLPA